MTLRDRFVRLAATFFYIGFFPGAPGSMASVAGLLIYIILQQDPIIYSAVLILVTVVGFLVSDRMEELSGSKDPSCIVIDEVSGIMIALFLLPINIPVLWCGFFLFRAFDMFKIYPVNKLEKMKGGVGVMMDDVVAGLYTNVVMQIAVRLAGVV